MSQDTLDTLKQPESNDTAFANFSDEQVDAVVIYLAKIARETLDKYGATEEQKRAKEKQFMAILNSWPEEFRKRVIARVVNCGRINDGFWTVPADAMIAATKAVELA